jgi:hypothetical protein
MKIQKKYQGAIPLNRIANEYNESETDTYSTNYINGKLSLSGGTMTGPMTLKMNQYMTQEEYGLDANNSDIIGVNGIYWGDDCNSQSEGLHFYKGETNGVKKYDSLMGYKGQLIWIPDNDTDTDVRKTEYTILGTHNTGDYIIEQGTKTGGWTYRKWKSGIVEAWVTLTKSLTVNQPEGTLYYDSCNFDIPSGLFTAAPTVNVSVLRSGGYGAYYTMGSISTTQCKGWVFSDLSSATAADHSLHIQAIGK